MAAERFIARSKVMRALAEQIRRFARADSNVLIAGETGTGKNVIARELHLRGKRAKQPFVTIDCPSLSTSLIDSELFGHERGAFTDAVTASPRSTKWSGGTWQPRCAPSTAIRPKPPRAWASAGR